MELSSQAGDEGPDLSVTKAAGSRDRDIRGPLQQWLTLLHADDPKTKIIHELEIPRPSARIDVAMINGRLAGFEIKSDADTLSRLRRQAACFSVVFERMTLVTTAKHIVHAPDHIPDWWGILMWESGGFKTKRRGRLNRALDLESLLHVLTREELRQVEMITRGKHGAICRRKECQIRDLTQLGKKALVTKAVRLVLKARPEL